MVNGKPTKSPWDGYENALVARHLLLLMSLFVYVAYEGPSNISISSQLILALTIWFTLFPALAWTRMIVQGQLPGAWLLKTQKSCKSPATRRKTGLEYVELSLHPRGTSCLLPMKQLWKWSSWDTFLY